MARHKLSWACLPRISCSNLDQSLLVFAAVSSYLVLTFTPCDESYMRRRCRSANRLYAAFFSFYLWYLSGDSRLRFLRLLELPALYLRFLLWLLRLPDDFLRLPVWSLSLLPVVPFLPPKDFCMRLAALEPRKLALSLP